MHAQDMALVEDCLRENNYESELAIVEVLQVMSLAQDTSTALVSKLVTSCALPHLVGLIESVLPTTLPAASAHHSQPHLLPNPLSHLLIQTNTSAASPSYSYHCTLPCWLPCSG